MLPIQSTSGGTSIQALAKQLLDTVDGHRTKPRPADDFQDALQALLTDQHRTGGVDPGTPAPAGATTPAAAAVAGGAPGGHAGTGRAAGPASK